MHYCIYLEFYIWQWKLYSNFSFGGWLSSFVLQLNIKHFLLWKTSDVHTRKNGIMNTLCSAQCTHQASAVINVLPFWFHLSPTLLLLLEYFKAPQVFYHFILTEVREALKITTISLSYLVHAYILSCFSHVQLFATPWTVACQAPLCPWGFSSQESWSGLPCPSPGISSTTGNKYLMLFSILSLLTCKKNNRI